MSDMTPDEIKARAIIDDYIHQVTGLTPEARFSRHMEYTWGKLRNTFMEAFVPFMELMEMGTPNRRTHDR